MICIRHGSRAIVRTETLYAVLGTALLLLSAIFAGYNSGDDKEESAGTACDRSVSEVQDLVSSIVEDVPGFAGCAPDPNNAGGYIINVTSPDVGIEAARTAILTQTGPSEVLENAELRVVQLDVSAAQDWYQQAHNDLLTALPEESRVSGRWHSADFDEVHNQGLISYANEENRAWAQSYILEEVNAPPGVIVAILAPEAEED